MINNKEATHPTATCPQFYPPVRPLDHGWIKDNDVMYELYDIRGFDHEGYEWVMAYGRDRNNVDSEWISYDDGQTWAEPRDSQ